MTSDNTAAIGNGWRTTTQTVTLTPTDGNGSGIAATYYTTDGSTPTTSSTQGTSISLSVSGQYTIQYFSVDNAGNVEPIETGAAVIRIDKVVPTNSISLASASGAFLLGTRLYYKSNAAGSFTLTNTVTDADSGPASGTFPAIATTGWTHNAEVDTTPAGGPYTSSLYSWTASPSAPAAAARTFTSLDVAGNASASTVLTFTTDSTAPTGGALTVNGTVATAGGSTSTSTGSTVTLARTDYAETQTTAASGLAASTLTIRSETLINAVCGAPGSGGPFTTPTVITGTSGPTLTLGFCYVYALTGTDQVGNTASLTTTVIAATPGVTNFTSTNGGATLGHADPGDTVSVTFNTPLDPNSVPATGTITLCNNLAGCSTSTHTLITISGLSSSAGFNVPKVLEKSGFSQTVAGSFTLSADHLTVTFADHRHPRREREDRRHDVDVQLRTLDDAARPERERRQRDLRHPDRAHALLMYPARSGSSIPLRHPKAKPNPSAHRRGNEAAKPSESGSCLDRGIFASLTLTGDEQSISITLHTGATPIRFREVWHNPNPKEQHRNEQKEQVDVSRAFDGRCCRTRLGRRQHGPRRQRHPARPDQPARRHQPSGHRYSEADRAAAGEGPGRQVGQARRRRDLRLPERIPGLRTLGRPRQLRPRTAGRSRDDDRLDVQAHHARRRPRSVHGRDQLARVRPGRLRGDQPRRCAST